MRQNHQSNHVKDRFSDLIGDLLRQNHQSNHVKDRFSDLICDLIGENSVQSNRQSCTNDLKSNSNQKMGMIGDFFNHPIQSYPTMPPNLNFWWET